MNTRFALRVGAIGVMCVGATSVESRFFDLAGWLSGVEAETARVDMETEAGTGQGESLHAVALRVMSDIEAAEPAPVARPAAMAPTPDLSQDLPEKGLASGMLLDGPDAADELEGMTKAGLSVDEGLSGNGTSLAGPLWGSEIESPGMPVPVRSDDVPADVFDTTPDILAIDEVKILRIEG